MPNSVPGGGGGGGGAGGSVSYSAALGGTWASGYPSPNRISLKGSLKGFYKGY